jgi:chromate transporter
VLGAWGRIGCTGFGGPPTHIALLRVLCVDRRRWLDSQEFEDAVAACNLLPGPASTPRWVAGAGTGAVAAVAAVAVQAGWSLVPASWARTQRQRASRVRWLGYLAAGAAAAAIVGPWLCSSCSPAALSSRSPGTSPRAAPASGLPCRPPLLASIGAVIGGGVLLPLGWVAFKVGALSYGGGFVIVPLTQGDAVGHYHWLSAGQFLNAVALGQITPGPVVQTVAAVGYAAAGVGGGLLASAVAFAPSFAFVLLGGAQFDRLRGNTWARGFLGGAGPAAIGAILGSALPLARALERPWQYAVLAAAAVLLLVLRRGVVVTLLVAAAAGILVALAGGPISR